MYIRTLNIKTKKNIYTQNANGKPKGIAIAILWKKYLGYPLIFLF